MGQGQGDIPTRMCPAPFASVTPSHEPPGHETGVVFLSGVRTGFGAFGGALKDLTATELGACWPGRGAGPVRRRVRAEVDHVVFGNVLQTSADAIYLARHVGLRAGLPIETPAVTVNRLCGSGFEAVSAGGAADPAGRVAGGARRAAPSR